MHETRNFFLVVFLIGAIVWGAVAFLILPPESTALLPQRIASVLLAVSTGAWLLYALKFEDKLNDHLAEVVGSVYYEADGLSFMPIVRVNSGYAELCVYYQNRYENPVEAIIHLRPLGEESFVIRPGWHDVHFAFMAKGGDFGVIHQRIAVPEPLKGDVIDVHLAAASWYPRSHGARLRKRAGMPCGTINVDWSGSAFKTGVHEVSGEIELMSPATLHLSMPKRVASQLGEDITWRQERLAAEEVERLHEMSFAG